MAFFCALERRVEVEKTMDHCIAVKQSSDRPIKATRAFKPDFYKW